MNIEAVVPIVGVMLAATTFLVSYLQTKRDRASRTVEMRQQHSSSSELRSVHGAAWFVVRGWDEPDPAERQKYRDIVLSGWVADADGKLNPNRDPGSKPYRAHFLDPASPTSELTEHQALSRLVVQWITLATYLELHLVDRRLAARLFRESYSYERSFLVSFRDAVIDGSGDSTFLKEIQQLDDYFKVS